MGSGFRDLVVWKKAKALAVVVYRETRSFPREEVHALTSQMRRAAVSVPSNLAEGHGRLSKKEFRHFVAQARGSLSELETQIEISIDLGFLPTDRGSALLEQAAEVGRIINGLLASLHRQIHSPEFSARRAGESTADAPPPTANRQPPTDN